MVELDVGPDAVRDVELFQVDTEALAQVVSQLVNVLEAAQQGFFELLEDVAAVLIGGLRG